MYIYIYIYIFFFFFFFFFFSCGGGEELALSYESSAWKAIQVGYQDLLSMCDYKEQNGMSSAAGFAWRFEG